VLQKLKESHGATLIPLIHKLHEKYILLSNELVNFHDNITNGDIQDPKTLGTKLLNYVIKLSEDGALLECNFSLEAL
jgi:hypothetical protein